MSRLAQPHEQIAFQAIPPWTGDSMLGCVGSDVLGSLYWVVVGGWIAKVPYGMRPEFCRMRLDLHEGTPI